MDIDTAAAAAPQALFADDDVVISNAAPENGSATATELVSAPSSSESPAPSASVTEDDSALKQMQGKILKQVEFYFSGVYPFC